MVLHALGLKIVCFDNRGHLMYIKKYVTTAKKILFTFNLFILGIGVLGCSVTREKEGSITYKKETLTNNDGRIITKIEYRSNFLDGKLFYLLFEKPTNEEEIKKTIRSAEYFEEGIQYKKQRQFKKAIAQFSKSLELCPRITNAYYEKGIAYCYLAQHKKAVEEFTKAIQIDKSFIKAYLKRAETKVKYPFATSMDKIKKGFKEAVEDYTRILEIDPRYINAYKGRSTAYWFLKKYDLALKDINTYIKNVPDDAQAYYDRGLTYAKMGKYGWAILEYSRAIALEDDTWNEAALERMQEAYFKKAQKLEKEGRIEDAVYNYKKLVEKDQNSETAGKAKQRLEELQKKQFK